MYPWSKKRTSEVIKILDNRLYIKDNKLYINTDINVGELVAYYHGKIIKKDFIIDDIIFHDATGLRTDENCKAKYAQECTETPSRELTSILNSNEPIYKKKIEQNCKLEIDMYDKRIRIIALRDLKKNEPVTVHKGLNYCLTREIRDKEIDLDFKMMMLARHIHQSKAYLAYLKEMYNDYRYHDIHDGVVEVFCDPNEDRMIFLTVDKFIDIVV